jgi:hypothetical protein
LSFCLAYFYGAAVFFVEGEESSERNEYVQSVNESGKNFGCRNPFIGKLGPNAARMELVYWLTNERAENPGQNRDVNDAPVSQFILYQFVFVLQRFFLTLSKWILFENKYIRINRLEVSNTWSFRFVFFLNTFSQFSEPNGLKLE